jgi:hypothetical protein
MPNSDPEAVSLLSEVEAPDKRSRIRVVCGPKGAPAGYAQVFARFVDTKQYFEDFVESLGI